VLIIVFKRIFSVGGPATLKLSSLLEALEYESEKIILHFSAAVQALLLPRFRKKKKRFGLTIQHGNQLQVLLSAKVTNAFINLLLK
jgi:hypothetical protein